MAQTLPRIVLGVDAGATKTHALVVGENGRVLGFGQAGPGNHQSKGLKPALLEIKRAVEAAYGEAGIAASMVETGSFCLAGADLPEDYAMLEQAIRELSLAQHFTIRNDTMAALRAGLSRPWGVVVICGTGFNAAGRSPLGEEIVLPGLGPISGDWGGGEDLSQEIIRLVMRAWDGRGTPTLLTRSVLEYLGLPDEAVLLSRLYHRKIDRGRLLDLVPLLFEAAEAGDDAAKELIVRMATEVGVTANALIRRLGLQELDVEVVLGGSVFKGQGPLLLDTATQVVKAYAHKASIKRLRHEPVVGAAFLALEAVGVKIDPPLVAALESTLPGWLRVEVPASTSHPAGTGPGLHK